MPEHHSIVDKNITLFVICRDSKNIFYNNNFVMDMSRRKLVFRDITDSFL